MNTSRRNFLRTLFASAAAFTILPPATTYERLWKATKPKLVTHWELNPDYVIAPYEAVFLLDKKSYGNIHWHPIRMKRLDIIKGLHVLDPLPLRFNSLDGEPIPSYREVKQS